MKIKLAILGKYAGILAVPGLLAACSSSDSSPAGSGGSTGDASTASTGGAGGTGGRGTSSTGGGAGSTSTGGKAAGSADAGAVSVSGVAVDITDGDATKNFDASKYPVVEGVEVCVYGDATVPCVKTDANGKYSLTGAVANTAFFMTYKKTGLVSYLYAVAATAAGNVDAPAMLMTTTAYSDSWSTKSGVTPDATKGIILFGATTTGPSSTPFHEMFGTTELFYLEGFTATISPAATAGPTYTSASWAPDKSLKASSAAGWGTFQAAPGDYTVTIAHPGMTCGSTQTKVVAGFSTTYVGNLCSPAASDGGSLEPTDAAPHPG